MNLDPTNHRKLILLVLSTIYLIGHFAIGNWKGRLYGGDSNGYYLHVVSLFVNQDVGNYDQSLAGLKSHHPRAVNPKADKFGIRLTEKGKYYIKYTVGVGLLESPFFLIAHAYAILSDNYEADGWSLPYMVVVNLSVVFYALLGLYLLMLSLEQYFDRSIVYLTVFAIGLATNLFYQATYATMAHPFLFFAISWLVYSTIHFYRNPSKWEALKIGAIIGLVALTRVPEVVVALVPILWGIYDLKTLKKRWTFFCKQPFYLLYAVVGFVVIFSPQLLYWYYVSGHLIFNPYQGEGFNFLKPNIYNGWFHFKNGWLIYTPIMAFSLWGWVLLRRYGKEVQWAVFSFVFLNAWIHYSYYIWNYFPGLGSRPMVETYPLLAFGLAAFFCFCQERKWTKGVPIPLILFFAWLNLFQTWQLKKGIIWTQHSSAAFYWETFGTLQPSRNSLIAYDAKEFQPDTTDLTKVKTIIFEDFEDSTQFKVSALQHHSGHFSLFDTAKFPNCVAEFYLEEHNIKASDWLHTGIHAFRAAADGGLHRNHLELLAVEFYDAQNKKVKWTHIKFPRHIGNPTNSIWHSGAVEQWGEGSFFVRVPWRAKPSWRVKIYIMNPHDKRIYLDDFYVDHYRN
ncbi:MAG: hypothetical protein AAGJ18_03935 [Bacteroidota bacterium]